MFILQSRKRMFTFPQRHRLLGRTQSLQLSQLLKVLAADLGVFQDVELSPEVGIMPEFDPRTSGAMSVQEFGDKYLVTELLSKYPFVLKGVDRDAVALATFEAAETQCSLVNSTIRVDTVEPSSKLSWRTVIETARRKVSHLLGPFSWDEAEVHCAFGPGATTSKGRRHADAVYKFGTVPDVTQDCSLLAWHAVRRIPSWFECLTNARPTGCWLEDYLRFPPEKIFRLVPGNRITTVPKNSKTNRVIAIEPDLNMYLQKGIGTMIRRRLLKAGINLNSQKLNQRLARLGSRYGLLATVDFKSASDTISREIVELLLPEDWLVALKQVRSPVGVLPDGKTVQFEKFSSMGNGFTFELESLIFWAIARVVVDLIGVGGIVSVYGDDLIVRSEAEIPLLWAFSRAGFTPNAKKSFFTGDFRESCGKHYFRGCDVTPFYVKKLISTPWDLFTLANNIRRWSRMGYGLDSRVRRMYDMVVEAIPEKLRYKIPEGLGDVGLISDFDEAVPDFDTQLYRLRAMTLIPVEEDINLSGLALLPKFFTKNAGRERDPGPWLDFPYRFPLTRRSVEPPETEVAVLSQPKALTGKRKNMLVQRWPTYGPWL